MSKRKTRRIIAAMPVLVSVILTPAAVRHAYEVRGGWAFGGEWLLIPLGLMVAWFVLSLPEMRRRGKIEKPTT